MADDGSANHDALSLPGHVAIQENADWQVQKAVVSQMETAFATSFQGVQLRSDREAERYAAAMNARAYTDGTEIGFAAGEFSPNTLQGLHLIAHEFAHVAQARGGNGGRPGKTASALGAEAHTPIHLSQAANSRWIESEADAAATAVASGQQARVSSAPFTLAFKKREGEPDKVPPSGSFFVAKVKGTYAYTFNSKDLLSWGDPSFKVFTYYAQDAFGVGEETAKAFKDYLADPKRKDFAEFPHTEIMFLGTNPVALAKTNPAVTVLILQEFHSTFSKWLKEKKLGKPQVVQVGYRDLKGDDSSGGKTSKGAGTGGESRKTVSGKGKQGGHHGAGGVQLPKAIVDLDLYYSYLLKHFPDHAVFTEKGATLNDMATFVGNRPEAYDALPRLPKDGKPPSNATPWQDFLIKWQAFLLMPKEFGTEEQRKGSPEGKQDKAPQGEQGGSPKGEEGGTPGGIIRFDASAELLMLDETEKYVKGGEVFFRVLFDRSSDDNYFMNFHPFVRRAHFDWTVYREGKEYDTGPMFEQGEREYALDLDKTGTYAVQVVITSPYFKNESLTLYKGSILVVKESERAQEIFNALLADPSNPDAPFMRDESGELKLKEGYQPLSIDDELMAIDLQIGHTEGLLDQRKISKDHADRYKKYLEDQKKVLTELKGEETRPDFERYSVFGTYLSRETSQYFRMQVYMHRKTRRKAPTRLYYEVELLDASLDPGNPTHHPGEGQMVNKGRRQEPQGWAIAERRAIKDMADHLHTYNDYPDGTVTLAIRRLEDSVLVRLAPIDTHSTRKTVKSVLGILGLAAGVIALAASPFTGGASAPVGMLVIQGVAIGAGVASVLMELQDRYEKEGELKFDRRLVLDILSLVGAVMGAGGFTQALRAAGTVGKLTYLGGTLGLDVASGVLMAAEVREKIREIEAIYAVKIADEPDPAKKKELERERDSAIAQILGHAAANGTFLLVSLASGTHQIVSAVGRKSGMQYSVRQEVVDLAASSKVNPDAVRTRLKGTDLLPEERMYLQESLLVPAERVPTSKGEVVEEKIARLGDMSEDSRALLRDPKKEQVLDSLVEHPLAAQALKKCASPCYPDNATPEQIARLETALTKLKKTGPYDEAALRDYLAANRDKLDEAIQEVRQANSSADLNAKLDFFKRGGKVEQLPASGDPKLKVEQRDRSHDIGVEHGQKQAQRDGLRGFGWTNPFENVGRYGQGFDDIMVKDGSLDTGLVYIVEYKGGGAGLDAGQMQLDWVIGNIRRLNAEGGPQGQLMARKLTTALREGRLRGIAYRTRIKNGAPQKTQEIGNWDYGKTNIRL